MCQKSDCMFDISLGMPVVSERSIGYISTFGAHAAIASFET